MKEIIQKNFIFIIITTFFIFGSKFLFYKISSRFNIVLSVDYELTVSILIIAVFVGYSAYNKKINAIVKSFFMIDNSIELFFVIFLFWSLFTGVFGLNPSQSIEAVALFMLNYILLSKIINSEIKNVNHLLIVFSMLFWIFLGVVSTTGYIVVINKIGFNPYVNAGRNGVFFNPNVLGLYSLILFLLSLLLLFNSKKKYMFILYYISIAVSIFILLFSGSRTCVAVSILSIIIIAFLFFKANMREALIHVAMIVILYLGISYFLDIDMLRLFFRETNTAVNTVNNTANNILSPSDIIKTLNEIKKENLLGSGRMIIWRQLIQYTVDNKLLIGIGIANTEALSTLLLKEVTFAHSAFIDIFVGTGLIGVILFTCFSGAVLYKLYNLYRLSFDKKLWITFFVLALSIIIHSLFENTINSPTHIIFQIFMLCTAAVKIGDNNIKNSEMLEENENKN